MKSTVHGDVPVNTAAAIVNEITLVGSRCGRFEPALELLRVGRFGYGMPMIDSRYVIARRTGSVCKEPRRRAF